MIKGHNKEDINIKEVEPFKKFKQFNIDVPAELYLMFKIKCTKEQRSMKGEVIEFMRNKVRGK